FAEGQSVPVEEVRLFLALREAAHVRLYAHVTWLRSHVLALVADYARGVSIDLAALEDAFRAVDISDPQAIQQAITSDVFAPQVTPAQEHALLRLETVLALVEGWVDEVVAAAAAAHLPQTVALREMIRRRRAAGGPGERAFASLVGLELRPRRSREAAALFAHVFTSGGAAAREAVWDHPDPLPTAADLAPPAGFPPARAAARDAAAPGERAFAGLVGLELRPRRSREAAALFAHVFTSGGAAAREAVWDHPDLLPTAADLDDPAGFLARREAARDADAEIDRALEDLLRGAEPGEEDGRET